MMYSVAHMVLKAEAVYFGVSTALAPDPWLHKSTHDCEGSGRGVQKKQPCV